MPNEKKHIYFHESHQEKSTALIEQLYNNPYMYDYVLCMLYLLHYTICNIFFTLFRKNNHDNAYTKNVLEKQRKI